MRPLTRFFSVLTLCALAVSLAGCDLLGGEDDGGGPGADGVPPEGPALVASMEGSGKDESALWLFDPQTLERTAVIETENEVPAGVAFSPDHKHWYVTWETCCGEDTRNVRAILDPTSGEITKRISTADVSVGDGQLFYEPITDHVVANGDSIEFFDPETLELVSRPFDGLGRAVVAEERGKLYFVGITEVGNQISAYDPAEQEISSTISLAGPPFSDIALSPGERYLYVTAWGGVALGPGRFYVVDLETGETIFEGGPVGKSANLAVHPNGRYVYIDCPAGRPGLLPTPTYKVRRFDVEARELEVFLEGSDMPSEVTGGQGLIAHQITMLPGGEAFVMYNLGAPIDEGAPPLVKVDAETGEVLATYALPRNEDGYARATVRQLHFGIVPE